MAEIQPMVGLRMVEELLLDISDTRSSRPEQIKTRIEAFVEVMDAEGKGKNSYSSFRTVAGSTFFDTIMQFIGPASSAGQSARNDLEITSGLVIVEGFCSGFVPEGR
jgi:hypothetical protein